MLKKSFFLGVCLAAFSFSTLANDTIRFTWQGSTSGKYFTVAIPCGEAITVDWGDGSKIDTVIAPTGNGHVDTLVFPFHVYSDSNDYAVIVAGLSNNCLLKWFWCQSSKLKSLDVSRRSALDGLYCIGNHLQLSDLYNASMVASNGYFGTQTLPLQTVNIGDTLDFSSQAVFGGTNTVFEVRRHGYLASPQWDYSISGGKIIFHQVGGYSITMTNASIALDSSARVIAQFNIAGVFPPTGMTLNHHQLTMNVGDRAVIRAIFTPSNADGRGISCNASSGHIAFARTAIDAFTVIANAPGVTFFYMYWWGGSDSLYFVDSCEITIIGQYYADISGKIMRQDSSLVTAGHVELYWQGSYVSSVPVDTNGIYLFPQVVEKLPQYLQHFRECL